MYEMTVSNRDRRREIRRNTNTPAILVFAGGRRRVGCIIRDLSPGGARLEVPGGVAEIPPTFDLFRLNRPPQPCRVAWRALREIGVAFV